jgi:hypothetical protein
MPPPLPSPPLPLLPRPAQIFGTAHAHHAFTAAAAALFTDDGASADRRRAEAYTVTTGLVGSGQAESTGAEAAGVNGGQLSLFGGDIKDEGEFGSSLRGGDNEAGPQIGRRAAGLRRGEGGAGPFVGGGAGLQMVANAREAALVDRAAALLGAYSKTQV